MSRILALALAGCSYAPTPATVEDAGGDAATDGAPPDTEPDALVCPAGFAAITGAPSMYRLSSTTETYAMAVELCATVGPRVHLARVDSQAEVDALFAAANAFYRVVGQRHLNNPVTAADDTWHDLDDLTELAFQPWGANEPTSLDGELCMSIREEFVGVPPPIVAGADDCTTPRLFFCECE